MTYFRKISISFNWTFSEGNKKRC